MVKYFNEDLLNILVLEIKKVLLLLLIIKKL